VLPYGQVLLAEALQVAVGKAPGLAAVGAGPPYDALQELRRLITKTVLTMRKVFAPKNVSG